MRETNKVETNVEEQMVSLGVLDPSLLTQLGPLNPGKALYDPSKALYDPSLVPVNPGQQQGSTNYQQNIIKNQPAPTTSQTNPFVVNSSQMLSDKGKQAKQELEILVATGKTKDLIGKQLTFNDLDYMSEKDILKYHAIYQQNMAARCNDAFGKLLIGGYAKLCGYDKLYNDLRNDYVLTNEIDRWVGWMSIKAGSLMALGTTGLITFNNTNFSHINEQPGGNNTDGRKIETSKKEK